MGLLAGSCWGESRLPSQSLDGLRAGIHKGMREGARPDLHRAFFQQSELLISQMNSKAMIEV